MSLAERDAHYRAAEGNPHTFTFTTTDPQQAERWLKAEAMCSVLLQLENDMREDEKYHDGACRGDWWRDHLRELMDDKGVNLEGIWS